VVAHTRLHLGSGGYGLLLGGVGIGAVIGAGALPRFRTRVSPAGSMLGGTVVFAGVVLSLAYVRVSALAALALVIGGAAWILILSTLNSQYQSTLPGWAKARDMSYYLVIFQGGGALGSAAFGVVAQRVGLTSALLAAGVGLALVAMVGLLLPFKDIAPEDLLPAGDWPDPQLVDAPSSDVPVLVSIEYRPLPGRAGACRRAARRSLRPASHRRDPLARVARCGGSRPGAGAVRRRVLG